jgi:hypothetical protein
MPQSIARKGQGRTIITDVNIEFSVLIQQTDNSCKLKSIDFKWSKLIT